jgi:glycosyltransferase involved in cell wall biosynthesis
MHVLVVTTVHVPSDARILHRQIRSLLDAGHEVTYAAAFRARGQQPPPDVATIELPAASGRRRWRALSAVRRLLSRPPVGVDVVLLHDPELLLAVATTRRRTPVVWDVHEDLRAALVEKTWLPAALRAPVRWAVGAVERWAESRCRLLLAEEAYQSRFRQEHQLVRNLPWQRPDPSGLLQPRAVYVGRISAGRGAHELVEMGRLLQPHGIETVLVGAADADVRGGLERAHRDGVLTWHGYLPNPEALALLDGAIAGLSLLRDQPNYRHSMPTKVVEYMERGLPVISTPLPLARDLVERHGCGVVVPFADPAAAASAVMELHRDAAGRAAMSARARAAAVGLYTWDAEAPGFVAFLEAAARDGA